MNRVAGKTFGSGAQQAVPAKEVMLAAFVALAIAAGYVAIAAIHGAMGASRNDDWVYLRSAYHFAEDGIFTPGNSMSMLVGQDILAWPVVKFFGPEIVPLQIMVASLGAVGLWAAYLIIRSALPPGWSAFSVGCLAVGPVFGSVSTSFMTDVPAFTLQMLALLAGLRALRKPHLAIGWYALSLLAGLAAFSIREYAVAAPLAIGTAVVLQAKPKLRWFGWKVVGLTVLWLVIASVLYWWRSGLNGSAWVSSDLMPNRSAAVSTVSTIAAMAQTFFTLAFFGVSLLPLISVPRLVALMRINKRTAILFGLVVFISWAALVSSGLGVLLGNYMTATGSYSVTLPGIPPVVIPPDIWRFLEVLVLVNILVLGFLALAPRHDSIRLRVAPVPVVEVLPDPGRTLIFLFCLTTTGVLGAVHFVTGAHVFDRYLIPMVPFVAALIVRAALEQRLVVERKAPVVAIALSVFAAFGFGFVDASATFDGAKWRLAQSVEAKGYAADSIDGGYEWFGYHQDGPVIFRSNDPGRNVWLSFFDEKPICVTSQFLDPSTTGQIGMKPRAISTLTVRSSVGVEYHLVAVVGPQSCQTNP